MKKRAKDRSRPKTPWLMEALGLLCLAAGFLFLVSLITYHPSDSKLIVSFRVVGPVKNMVGPVGAYIAQALMFIVGVASYWLPLLLFVLTLYLVTGRRPNSYLLLVAGHLGCVFTTSVLAQMIIPRYQAFGDWVEPSGGLVGLAMSLVGVKYLNQLGTAVISGTLFVCFFMFSTGLRPSSLARGAGRGAKWCLGWIHSLYTRTRERRRKAKKKEEAEPAPRPEPPVIIEAPVVSLPEPEPEQVAFSFMEPLGDFTPPPFEFLSLPLGATSPDPEYLEMNSRILTKKLADFGVEGRVVEVLAGPVVTMYEFEPAAGVKISRVASLQDDLALALHAAGVRVVAPIPGKGVIGIEIPNADREMVVLREVLQSDAFNDSRSLLTVALGKDTLGRPVVTDLTRMPHLLIAGATGTGKSVCINSILMSLLYNASPQDLRLLLIDPKRIELNVYESIPHLLHPVVVEPAKATSALRWAVGEMERRYALLARVGARNIASYNAILAKAAKKKKEKREEEEAGEEELAHLPYIVVAVDELSDLMIVASREVEEHITRLAQMARAAGIHLVVATQRPSVDVITGLIKANIPARISFKVSSRVDSRTVLDASGAETLLGSGDMLFLPPGTSKLVRIHGALITEPEIRKVVEHLKNQGAPAYELTLDVRRHEELDADEPPDEMYEDAVRLVLEMGQASISMVQRRLRVGYNRAARMIERMERDGIVGPSDGVKPREVLGPGGRE